MFIEACNQLMLTQEHTNHLKAHRFQTFLTSIHFEMVSNMDSNQTKAFSLTTWPDCSVHDVFPTNVLSVAHLQSKSTCCRNP